MRLYLKELIPDYLNSGNYFRGHERRQEYQPL